MVREFVKAAQEGDKDDVDGRHRALLYKTFRDSRDALKLARRTARETRIAMMLATIGVALLIVAISMLWLVLEHVTKI
jgi:hypothetical protein